MITQVYVSDCELFRSPMVDYMVLVGVFYLGIGGLFNEIAILGGF